MRHLNSGRQLGRNSSHRRAMYRNMAASLLKNESITTTDIKAKELRRYVEKLVTLGKKGTLAARRMARVKVDDKEALQKLFSSLAERFKERQGGYTRIIKVGMRPGDNAPMSVIQLLPEDMPLKKKTSSKKKTVTAKEMEEKETAKQKVEKTLEEESVVEKTPFEEKEALSPSEEAVGEVKEEVKEEVDDSPANKEISETENEK